MRIILNLRLNIYKGRCTSVQGQLGSGFISLNRQAMLVSVLLKLL